MKIHLNLLKLCIANRRLFPDTVYCCWWSKHIVRGLTRLTLHPPLKLTNLHVDCSIRSLFQFFHVTIENIGPHYHSWGIIIGCDSKFCCGRFWGTGSLTWHNSGLSSRRKVNDPPKCLSWTTLKAKILNTEIISIIRSPEVKRSRKSDLA